MILIDRNLLENLKEISQMEKENSTIEMEKYYKRWNVSWGIGAGFQYDRYYLRFTYNFGLVNPYTKDAFKEMDIPYDCEDRLTRGRLDDWSIRLGVFLWSSDK